MSKSTIHTVLLTILTFCAAVMTTRVLGSESLRSLLQKRRIAKWQALQQPSSLVRQGDGSITIIEFADFQCPFCARAQATIHELEAKYPGRVRVLYRHLPLQMHAHATEAAEAAECANEQRTFARFHDVLFAEQDSIGIKSWKAFADEAGVPDIAAFTECVRARRYASRVQTDAQQAEALGFNSTPTFLINGNIVRGAKPISEFVKHVR